MKRNSKNFNKVDEFEALEDIWQPIKTNLISFTLNGNKINIPSDTITPATTLNEYLRDELHLTGTKYMCLEGGCGACIVTAIIRNPVTNSKETHAVNSCLVALLSCQNWEIITIEHLGNQNDGLHKIQEQIIKFNGTQCGFCTPGMVMNMYSLQESNRTKMAEIENSFGGNMCRCTGYRSILTAFKGLATDSKENRSVDDIEDFSLCSTQDRQNCKKTCFPGLLKQAIEIEIKGSNHMVEGTDSQKWYNVQSIKEIFILLRKNCGKSYQLVAGNTAKGVYRDMAQKEIFIDITNVKDLKTYQHNTKSLKLGGNMTLTEVMRVFREVAEKDDGFKYLRKLAEHIDLVAHVPVQNIGTIAGNLSIKHTHNEFPSDIFLLLQVVSAEIIIDDGSLTQALLPHDYLNVDMNQKIIRQIKLHPVNATYKLESFKIMQRGQNTHAILNAGFLFSLDSKNVVTSASIVFGNVSGSFNHAKNSEVFIKGKQLYDNGNLQKLFSIMYDEIHPIDSLPDPSPEFRRQLAVALMYKFILGIVPDNIVSIWNKTGGQKLERPLLSTGVQEFHVDDSMFPVGKPVGKLEGPIQATGEAKYIVDMPDLKDQCYAAFVLGKAVAGSVLQEIDPSEALELEGVEIFLQASNIDDLKGINSFIAPDVAFGHVDEEIFLPIGQTIKFYYEPVGAIVARSRRLAEKAAEMVKVIFNSTVHSPILTTKEAIEHDKTEKDESKKRIHYIETHFARTQNQEVSQTIQGVFETAPKYHYHMELQVVNVIPNDDGTYDIYPSTQWMESVQSSIHRALNIPAHKLRVFVNRVGGSFGGKITRNNWISVVATLAALKLKKPVKFMISLRDNMNIIGKRNAYRSEYSVGVHKDGKIGFLNNNIYNNVGAFENAMLESLLTMLYEGTYTADAFQTNFYWARTDNPAATMMRGPGSFEGCAIIENIMEHVAFILDKDPIDVRLANLKSDKDLLLTKLIDDCLQWSDYRKRRSDIDTFNKDNRWRKKGIAIVPMIYNLYFPAPFNVQVSIFQTDGTVAISHCGIEIGQGINTKTVQAAAYLFGIPISMVHIWPSNNFTSPNCFCTGGAITTESVIIALNIACKNLLTRINVAATNAQLPSDAKWLSKVQSAFSQGVSLTENQHFSQNPKNPITYSVYGICVSEVEVDILTGSHLVTRVDLMEDAGNSLNPALDIGQCEGAFVMGMGNWTMENIVVDEEGALKTNSTWWYKIPGAKDIPVNFRVKLPDGIPNTNPAIPFKNKATSEPPICLSFSVPLAIRHALKSARLQSDKKADPWITMEGPATVEWIFSNALSNFQQYVL